MTATHNDVVADLQRTNAALRAALAERDAAHARLVSELNRHAHDLQEAREYQAAASKFLDIISHTRSDLSPVFEAVVSTAARLCRAHQAVLFRNHNGVYRWAASFSNTLQYDKIEREAVIHPGQGTIVGRAAMARQPVQILDAWNDPLYDAKDDARVGGARTMLGVPLLHDGEPIGVLGLARRDVEPYTDPQIQLV